MAKKPKKSKQEQEKAPAKNNSNSEKQSKKDQNQNISEPVEIEVSIEQLLTPLAIIVGSIIISVSVSLSLVFGVGAGVGGSVAGINAANCDPDEPYSDECLTSYAQEINLNINRFQQCVENEEYDSAVDEDLEAAQELGLGGTPSFLFAERTNGDDLRGFQIGAGSLDIETLETLITQLENEGIDATAESFLQQQLDELGVYEAQVRDFYSQQGQTGEQLEQSVEQQVNTRESEIRSNAELKDFSIGQGALKGDESSRAVLVEFSDYECPYCQTFAAGTGQQIIEELVEPGELLFVYRDFPLESIHANARKLAIAARCAGDQDKYFEMHDQIFGLE